MNVDNEGSLWARLPEWEDISAASVFCSPLSNACVEVFTEGESGAEELFVYKTPEGLLGKMLVKQGGGGVSVRYKTHNTFFGTDTMRRAAVCEGELRVVPSPHDSTSDLDSCYLDLSGGGFGVHPRSYRKRLKEEGPVPGPCVGVLRVGDAVVFSPVRSTLLARWAGGSGRRVERALKAASAARTTHGGDVDNWEVLLYGCLPRSVSAVTHLSPDQVAPLWKLFLNSSASGPEDHESGLAVFLTLDELPAFLRNVLRPGDFLEEGGGEEYEEAVAGFLESESFREGLWWLLSEPVGAAYAAMTPTSKRVNRCVKFPRVVDVLSTVMMPPGKEHVVEFVVRLLTPGPEDAPGVLTKRAMRNFFASAFPGEDADELVEMFEDVFEGEAASLQKLRYALFDMNVFQTWSALTYPFLGKWGWNRSNPDL